MDGHPVISRLEYGFSISQHERQDIKTICEYPKKKINLNLQVDKTKKISIIITVIVTVLNGGYSVPKV